MRQKSIGIFYDVSKIDASQQQYMPEKASRFFEYNFGELRNYAGIPKRRLSLFRFVESKSKARATMLLSPTSTHRLVVYWMAL